MNRKLIAVSIIGIISLLGAVSFYYLGTRKEPARSTEYSQPAKTHEGAAYQAQLLEDEANRLIETDADAAEKKFIQASELYKDAGEELKSAEMKDSASTARAISSAEYPPTEEPPMQNSISKPSVP